MAVRFAVVLLSLMIISGQATARGLLGDRDRDNDHDSNRMTSAGKTENVCNQNGFDTSSKVADKACAATQVGTDNTASKHCSPQVHM